MNNIEESCLQYSKAVDKLTAAVTELNDELEQVKRRRLDRIKRLTADAASAKASLHHEVEAFAHLFQSPKTQIFHGVKVGLVKQKGTVIIANEEKLLAKIKRLYDESAAAQLIRTTETPDKNALRNLPGAELAKLGVELSKDSDAVVIKLVAGDIEKLVNALLKEAVAEAVESQAGEAA